jgi:hypothetical protein
VEVRFDRWTYDLERNRFVNRPVTTIATTIQDDLYINALYIATITAVARRIEAAWMKAFQQLQKKIEGDE